MNVSLTPELETYITAKVETGMYHSVSEVVREGLRLLREQDALREIRREELRREIRQGLESVRQGDFTEYAVGDTLNLVGEIKAEGRRRKAERGG